MRIVLNGEPVLAPDGLTVIDLLRREGEPEHHVLVEINHLFVPPAEHRSRVLQEGDRVEIILPAFGG